MTVPPRTGQQVITNILTCRLIWEGELAHVIGSHNRMLTLRQKPLHHGKWTSLPWSRTDTLIASDFLQSVTEHIAVRQPLLEALQLHVVDPCKYVSSCSRVTPPQLKGFRASILTVSQTGLLTNSLGYYKGVQLPRYLVTVECVDLPETLCGKHSSRADVRCS